MAQRFNTGGLVAPVLVAGSLNQLSRHTHGDHSPMYGGV
jgi:hypothetical protein